MTDKAAVPDTNILLYWTIPSDLFPEELEEKYEAVEEYMDDKVEDWDIYISPIVKKEFGRGVVEERVRHDSDLSPERYVSIKDSILRRTKEKIDEIDGQIYSLDECEEPADSIDKSELEFRLYKKYKENFSQLSKEEKTRFRDKTFLPGVNDIKYLADGLRAQLEPSSSSESAVYEELILISEDRHISRSKSIELLHDLGLEVVTVDDILQSVRGEEDSQTRNHGVSET